MQTAPRIRALQDRHAAIDARLTEQAVRPRPDDVELAKLKLEKLKLKDEMERLRGHSAH